MGPARAVRSRRSPPRRRASRAGVRAAFTKGLSDFIDILATYVPGRGAEARRRKALATMSGMVGAMVLARAVTDPRLSTEILNAGAKTFRTRRVRLTSRLAALRCPR